MKEVYALVSADNIDYNIDCTIFSNHEDAYQQMVKELEGIKETLCAERIEYANIDKHEARIYDGNDLYYWNIKKRKIVSEQKGD